MIDPAQALSPRATPDAEVARAGSHHSVRCRRPGMSRPWGKQCFDWVFMARRARMNVADSGNAPGAECQSTQMGMLSTLVSRTTHFVFNVMRVLAQRLGTANAGVY